VKPTTLQYGNVYRVTDVINGKDDMVQIGLAVRQKETPLPEGEMGVELRWLTNGGYERSERRITGAVMRDEGGVIEVRHDDDENMYVTIFEPLTLDTWKAMKGNIIGFDELVTQLTTDEELRQWYWHEYVGDSWSDDPF
jgi:hypothetical protein